MSIRFPIFIAGLLAIGLGGCSAPEPISQSPAALPALSGTEAFVVMVSGTEIGGMTVDHTSGETVIAYEFRNNGRGPTIDETIELNEAGYPTVWRVVGATTFGNKVDESFDLEGSTARWTDATGSGSENLDSPALYVAQNASPYSLWLYARALLSDEDQSIAALPGGTLQLTELETFNIDGTDGEEAVTTYSLSGISLNPTYILLDANDGYVGFISPRFSVLREGYESNDEAVRARAVEYSAQRFEDIQAEVANNFDGSVRIENVRLFDPQSEALTEPVSVTFEGNTITAIGAPEGTQEGVTVIDGAGGTLVAGMFEMHGHLSQNSALLNVAAGVTSVRDMGNSNEVLGELNAKIENGRLVGPRIIRSGFIEGKSPFSSNNGELVSTQEEAIEAVRRYGNGEFHQIKIYNSMKGEWVAAMIEEARGLGLRVAGHVPAFSNADQMIAAGYDEMTHINQVMLGWVLDEGEDTRTLLRLTALRRLPGLDIESAPVQATINAMAENGTAIDPTLAIHEALLRSRNGEVRAGVVDYIDHMPVSEQRSAKTAWADVSAPGDDEAYYEAFDKIIETVTAMREAGIQLVPGTDMGGSFVYHRELELYQNVGMSAPEILAWATYGMADYVGQADQLGSIEENKLADFFLIPGDPTEDLKAIKTISMVVKDGTVYFPSEIYPSFGITPFAEAPEVIAP